MTYDANKLAERMGQMQGNRDWARKLVERWNAGDRTISPYALQMARNALDGSFRTAGTRVPGEDDR